MIENGIHTEAEFREFFAKAAPKLSSFDIDSNTTMLDLYAETYNAALDLHLANLKENAKESQPTVDTTTIPAVEQSAAELKVEEELNNINDSDPVSTDNTVEAMSREEQIAWYRDRKFNVCGK